MRSARRKAPYRKRGAGNGSYGLRRRDFLKVFGGAAAAGMILPYSACSVKQSTGKKVVMLGLDGMDPNIVERMWAEGRLPTFKRLAENGGFRRLGTSTPPQSPVAWSNVITGMNSGGHGICDFVHRRPRDYRIYFSMSETVAATNILPIGDIRIPLEGGKVLSLRRGLPFWRYLTEKGISAVVFKMPVNFPPDSYATRAVSGMGTPDIKGGYGEFTYYTSDRYGDRFPHLAGGKVEYVDISSDRTVRARIIGPENNLVAEREPTIKDRYPNNVKVPFTVYLDRYNPVAKIEVQGRQILLKEGEFSDWIKLNFEMLPMLGSVSGICRFYLKQVQPFFKLYFSPINIDPMAPALPISHPADYAGRLAHEIGLYYTQGLPADWNVRDSEIFNDADYATMARLVLDERMRQFDSEWERFDSGFFFFYVSSTDQDMHMFWRSIDPEHHLYHLADDNQRDYIFKVYDRMDELLAKVLGDISGDTTLLVISDHGFASYNRAFHLNAWLKEQGFLALQRGSARKKEPGINDIDWSGTGAYGVGINGLYINMRNREGEGIVDPAVAEALKSELIEKLEAVVDEEMEADLLRKLDERIARGQADGSERERSAAEIRQKVRPILKVYRREEIYQGPEVEWLPDLVVGYNRGYRSSGPSARGVVGDTIFDFNPLAWSGDHCMDPSVVPGILFSNRPIAKSNPSLVDIPVTILSEFGIEKPEQMIGSSVFEA
jgi:predicted AlkP superfamily phosphohydrolase/phosphomutase